ncbi:unnamed protein product [Urochloa decumbens]|uniref:Polygalacturonase n=1 Tax=Urochloa decumbens TaxID=240449 RepID=A0ABC9F6P8_9POAL
MGAVGIIVVCAAAILLAGLAAARRVADDAAAAGELAFDVVAYGARGDGTTDDTKVCTRVRVVFFGPMAPVGRAHVSCHVCLWFRSLKAFEDAWAAACGARGPSASMVVPEQRTFLVGPVNFHGPCASGRIIVQIQGKIVAPPSTSASTWSSVENLYWLMFSRVDGLSVTGSGVLDGNGQSWWIRRCNNDVDCLQYAPTALKLVGCNNLELSQFSSVNSPQMHIVILQSSGVSVSGLTIAAPWSSPNTDGIHIERSQNVKITSSSIGTGDDCVSIGSGSHFVTVDGLNCGPGHGVSIGSLGKNGDTATVEFIDVKNVHFNNTMNGARIKTWEGGLGYAKSISFTNIEFDNVDHPVIIDQFYRDRSLERAVSINNVTYSNLNGTSSQTAVSFDCSDGGSCTDIHVDSMNIRGPDGQQTVARCRNAQVVISGQVYPEIPCSS